MIVPTFSVLIRTHNAIDRIPMCVDSVYFNQCMYPDKIFICDDYSTDGTWEHLVSLYGNDSRIALMRNDSNHGPGYTMKRLVMTCDTDYYMLIDDDDYWIRNDVIERVKTDVLSNSCPDKLYYKANDIFNCRLHVAFAYKTEKMRQLIYFSLWRHDDDYTLQTLGDNFSEIIIDNYEFYCQYIPHTVSQLSQSAPYRYLHTICKNIYLNRIEKAKFLFDGFPYMSKCEKKELVIYDELSAFFCSNPSINPVLKNNMSLSETVFIQGSSLKNIGLFQGRTGLAIFCYMISRISKNRWYEEYAGELLDAVIADLSQKTVLNFANGLAGIGWTIEYLVQNQFIVCDTNEVLEEFDQRIMQLDVRWVSDNSLETGVLGIYAYVMARLGSVSNKNVLSPFPEEYLSDLFRVMKGRPQLCEFIHLSFDDVWNLITDYYLSNLDWIKYRWQLELIKVISAK